MRTGAQVPAGVDHEAMRSLRLLEREDEYDKGINNMSNELKFQTHEKLMSALNIYGEIERRSYAGSLRLMTYLDHMDERPEASAI